MSKEPPAVPSSTFFTEELERALLECGFGILSWEVESSDGASGGAAQARAKVELLPESDNGKAGIPVQVSLSIKGYQLQSGPDHAQSDSRSQFYETLDDLLSSSSPAFQKRRTKLLFEKLEDVAAARSWNDYDEAD